ncbi:DUF134 domain-containing protein [Xanthobacteraceae bacterium Astr-EGSB]|uniref:DUF134 domain-containing protein n=1 Tax=Astrobacterium formosum TaxID=3069710 RepID=UPI0027B7D4CC|nr:DUF134 domain-containing protein [Xanthobacteraceae bacterium Astr-EGSB]
MPRPRKLRLIQRTALVGYYKPQGIPLSELIETVLSLDGLEALRFADVEGLEQADAAARMGISRPTFSRLLAEARSVVATALSQGWAIRIDGGPVETAADGPEQSVCVRRRTRRGIDTRPAAEPIGAAAEAGEEDVNTSWIAVSARGATPDAEVDPRFGRAEWFVLFDTKTQRWSYLSNRDAQAQAQGAGLAAVELLAEAQVVKVVSGSIGPKAARALSAAGIAAVEGAAGRTVREALGLILDASEAQTS